MDKQILERFITKYTLGASPNSALIISDNGTVNTSVYSDDKHAMGFVSTDKIELVDGEYGIYDTARLRSLLGVLGDTIKIKIIKSGTSPTGLLITSTGAKATFVLADKQNLPVAPAVKTLPPFEVTINIDDAFIYTFVRAKSALPDVETFTFITDGKTPTIVLGYSKINTNRVTMDVTATTHPPIDPISFSAEYMREILSANKEMGPGALEISSKGIAYIHFTNDDFTTKYYLMKRENV